MYYTKTSWLKKLFQIRTIYPRKLSKKQEKLKQQDSRKCSC